MPDATEGQARQETALAATTAPFVELEGRFAADPDQARLRAAQAQLRAALDRCSRDLCGAAGPEQLGAARILLGGLEAAHDLAPALWRCVNPTSENR